LKYDGIKELQVKGKELHIPTSVGTLKELQPYTYQYTETGKKEIGNRYIVKNNVVRFDVKKYDRSSTLVIDPTLIFCSFSGSTVENWGFTATYGPDGSMYGGGIVFGGGFPTSPGAFSSTYGGTNEDSFDMGIIKLTPDGSNRVYATYIGGKGKEQPHSLVVDDAGNLIIAGRTNSADYPTRGINTVGATGGFDIVVTKLNASGTALIGSLKIGGLQDDGVNISTNRAQSSLQRNYGDDGRSEVILDQAGNICVASCMQSAVFPMNGPQRTFGGGTQDGVILKLSPDVSNVFYSTYVGGKANDAAYVLSINPLNGELYVGGGTESDDLPGRGGLNASIQGGIDGFVARYNTSGALIRTTYIGTTGPDQVFGVQFDKFGFPYIMGQTTTAWRPVNATWSQSGAQFIAKLQPDLSAFVYSTTFGTANSNPNISPVAFLVDRCENVYVSGWGGSINRRAIPLILPEQ
jgi:hypothetical protein